MPVSVGSKLGPYEILAPIGAGGMGEVYRARDARLGRDVAIKISAERFSERFDCEARSIASLNHTNVCHLYDVGPNYLVMELVEGETLRGPMKFDEALPIIRQLIDGIEAAHEKNIVHRDLKPANIKITPEGAVKILDFGLAKASAAEPEASSPNSPTNTMGATVAGTILGTAAYMSPEQARGKTADRRSDIWSFGVVVYELLTGKSAFEGETAVELLGAVINREPDWSRVPSEARRLLAWCLEKDRKERLQAIGDARRLLKEMPAREATAPSRSRLGVWAYVALAALGVGFAAGWGLFHHPKAEPRTPVHWTYNQKEAFGSPILSRDGSRMAAWNFVNGKPHILQRMLDQPDFKLMPGTDGMAPLDFSPDSQWLVAETTEGQISRIPVNGGDAVPIAKGNAVGVTGSWGDDGSIAFIGEHGLMRVSSSGGDPQPITKIDAAKGETAHSSPFFLPSAKALLFTVAHGPAGDIAALDLKSGKTHIVVKNGVSPRYTPQGYLLFLRARTLFAVPFDANRQLVTGAETAVAAGLSNSTTFGAEYAVSDSGLLVYMSDPTGAGFGTTTLAWMDRSGQTDAVSDTLPFGNARLSPDGRRVVSDIRVSPGGASGSPADIWVFDRERRTRTRITSGGNSFDPAWTPDGRRVVFGSTVDGKNGIFWAPADGSGKPELLLSSEPPARAPTFSPDGRWLLYNSAPDGTNHIWLAPFSEGAAGKPTLLHPNGSREGVAQVSPDGHWVAYQSSATGKNEIYLEAFPAPAVRELVSTQGGSLARWSRDGKRLYYLSSVLWMAVDLQYSPGVRAGIPRPLVQRSFGTSFDAAPDGQHFLVELLPFDDARRSLNGITDWTEELRHR